jgi:hypothetical protein
VGSSIGMNFGGIGGPSPSGIKMPSMMGVGAIGGAPTRLLGAPSALGQSSMS